MSPSATTRSTPITADTTTRRATCLVPPRDRHVALPDRRCPRAPARRLTSAAATFNSGSDQSIPLDRHGEQLRRGTINEGIVTFTILQNNTPVGSSVSGNVTNNQASATYDLLAGTAGGTYTIQAVYTDPADYSTSTGTNQLIVSAAATTVIPADASARYSADHQRGSHALRRRRQYGRHRQPGERHIHDPEWLGTEIGSPVTVNVLNGVASENATLPAGTAAGSVRHRRRLQRHVELRGVTTGEQHPDGHRGDDVDASHRTPPSASAPRPSPSLSPPPSPARVGPCNTGTVTFTILERDHNRRLGRHCQRLVRNCQRNLSAARRHRDRHVHHRGRLQRHHRLRRLVRHHPHPDRHRAAGHATGDPHAAVVDGHRRPDVPDPARHLRRGPVRQPRDERQQHRRDRLLDQRHRPASGNVHGHGRGRNRHLHEPRRQHGRDHHAQVLER